MRRHMILTLKGQCDILGLIFRLGNYKSITDILLNKQRQLNPVSMFEFDLVHQPGAENLVIWGPEANPVIRALHKKIQVLFSSSMWAAAGRFSLDIIVSCVTKKQDATKDNKVNYENKHIYLLSFFVFFISRSLSCSLVFFPLCSSTFSFLSSCTIRLYFTISTTLILTTARI